MFQKSFRVKSQTAIKGSDRKKLRAEIVKQFPGVPIEQMTEMIPNKGDMTIMKIYTHAGDTVLVYCIGKNPAFFEAYGVVYPTVYTLWAYPDLMPVFATWPPVLTKLVKGADLMLPGVIVTGEMSPTVMGDLNKGQPCSVKLLGNKCPVAVGKTALSSSDMFDAAMRGKGVIILHTYQDQLWLHGDKSELPLIDDREMLEAMKHRHSDNEEDIESDTETEALQGDNHDCDNQCSDERTHLEDNLPVAENGVCDHLPSLEELSLDTDDRREFNLDECEMISDELEGAVGGVEEEDPQVLQERMDGLFYSCFLCAVKSSVKKTDLPLLTSTFYKQHMCKYCPSGISLDVKKSSHKKLSKFLLAMKKKGLVNVRELQKGVESLTEIHKDHPEIRAFVVGEVPEPGPSEQESNEKEQYVPPEIQEMYMVSTPTLPLFQPAGYGKNSALTAQEVRQRVTDYVKAEELQNERRTVTLDYILSDVVVSKAEYITHMEWNELFSRVYNRMSPACQISFPGQKPQLKKGKIEPVTLDVAQRAGNKKVTLVHNLEMFGIDPAALAHTVQVGVACSTSVNPLPGKNKGHEVLVQGNQINFIANLLLEKYHLPKKYLRGIEKAPKLGKRRR